MSLHSAVVFSLPCSALCPLTDIVAFETDAWRFGGIERTSVCSTCVTWMFLAVQIVGVCAEELKAAQQWNGRSFVALMQRVPGAGGPWLVTDMRRGETVFELDPGVQVRPSHQCPGGLRALATGSNFPSIAGCGGPGNRDGRIGLERRQRQVLLVGGVPTCGAEGQRASSHHPCRQP